MPEDEERCDEDEHVEGQIQPLRRKELCGAVDALGLRELGRIPLRLEGHATNHLGDELGKVACEQDPDNDEAQVLFPGQDGDAVVLEHDRQLKEEVGQGVKLNDTDPDLQCPFSAGLLSRGGRGQRDPGGTLYVPSLDLCGR